MKYPRTYHLPWSLGKGSDDKVLTHKQVDTHFLCKQLVLSEKLDGENTTMTCDDFHARSLDSAHHDSQAYVKNMWGRIRHLIQPGIRIHGENVYAKHSIKYTHLPEYFLVFGVSDGDYFLSVDATKRWAKYLGLECVKFIEDVDLNMLELNAFKPLPQSDYGGVAEGYVVRNVGKFPIANFRENVAKFVRDGHVQTSQHWKSLPIERNGLLKQLGRGVI